MKAYFSLFNAITDAIRALQDLQLALILAQQKAEDMYLDEPGE
jgi:hypothetical protein